MKPTKFAAEILIIEDPNYSDGLYAYVDFDEEDRSQYRRLKWVCEDAHWQAVLNATLNALEPDLPVHHYHLFTPNPTGLAARYVKQHYGIRILSEGIVVHSGVPAPGEGFIVDEEEEVRRQDLDAEDE